VPISSVGIYVPGNLPSTLLMNAIPAKLAKVKKLVLATPKIDGNLNSAVLYAAKKVGIKEIYSMGGAQAIASLAYIQKVNKIVGPGNKFVAEAKRQLSGKLIGTESMYAGASEICVWADKDTNVNQVITSLVSQAEHDPNSQCILVTKDKRIINDVKKGISKSLKNLPRKKIAISSIKKNGLIVKTNNDKQIIDVINEIAPEHLELNVKNYSKYSKKIFNSGSICNGRYTPMSVSDYTVGTNHVLPTLGSSKFSSGLNINEFIKRISVVTLTKLGVEKIGNPAITLSEFEQLDGHAQSIKSRIRRN
jgi:histidinol dehydrogenase